jgi:O-antigen ligase
VLGLDLYLTLSRGAIGACLVGVAVVVVLVPTRAGLRAALVVGAAATLAALAALALPGVQHARGSTGEGPVMIVVLAVLGGWAAFAVRGADGPLPRVRPLATVALAALLVGTVIAAAGGGRQGPASSTEPNRLVSVQSNRYAYWRVAGAVFADHPLLGAGSGAFAVEWLQRREIAEGVRDAHSLYVETAAELGLIGLLALAALIAGVVLAARAADSAAAVAAVVAFGLHAGVDWDWEMPALSLVAVLLVARLVASSE